MRLTFYNSRGNKIVYPEHLIDDSNIISYSYNIGVRSVSLSVTIKNFYNSGNFLQEFIGSDNTTGLNSTSYSNPYQSFAIFDTDDFKIPCIVKSVNLESSDFITFELEGIYGFFSNIELSPLSTPSVPRANSGRIFMSVEKIGNEAPQNRVFSASSPYQLLYIFWHLVYNRTKYLFGSTYGRDITNSFIDTSNLNISGEKQLFYSYPLSTGINAKDFCDSIFENEDNPIFCSGLEVIDSFYDNNEFKVQFKIDGFQDITVGLDKIISVSENNSSNMLPSSKKIYRTNRGYKVVNNNNENIVYSEAGHDTFVRGEIKSTDFSTLEDIGHIGDNVNIPDFNVDGYIIEKNYNSDEKRYNYMLSDDINYEREENYINRRLKKVDNKIQDIQKYSGYVDSM